MKRDEKALDRIISRLSKEWQADGRKAVDRLYSLLKRGKKTAEAIDIVRKEYPALFTVINVQPALIEAAAYGYGIVPSVLTVAQWDAWGAALSTSWDGSGMTLSKKLHGADTKMREAITDTIRDQLKRNATWTEAAQALYDGYEHGNVVRPQQLPKYLSAVRYATQGSPEALAEARKVFYNIERLSKSGAPTKSLRAAYASLVKAAQTGTEEQLEKACYVAVQEKSRYVAQRIIRTELSRAYSDGFNAKIMQDDDVVAVRLRLSTTSAICSPRQICMVSVKVSIRRIRCRRCRFIRTVCAAMKRSMRGRSTSPSRRATSSRQATSGRMDCLTAIVARCSASKETKHGSKARTGRSICGTGGGRQSLRRG